MTSLANFKSMFESMGWDAHNSVELVQVHGIKTMVQLARVDEKRSSRIVKAIRTPGGNAAGLLVAEDAEHGLMMTGMIICDYKRLSRTLTCAALKNLFNDEDTYDVHDTQYKLEMKWDNDPGMRFFQPLTEKITKGGWKPFDESLKQNLNMVRGPTTRVPLVYLIREELIAEDEDDDDQDDYPDFDSQLVKRFPIIQATHETEDADELEALEIAGPSK